MSLQDLEDRIGQQRIVLGVIGLGYVGLPVACSFAQQGFRVVGLDIKSDRVATINAGRCPIEGDEPGLANLLSDVVRSGRLCATTDYSLLSSADIILINVETPVDHLHQPNYHALRAACRSLGLVMKDGVLVIVESTIAPRTVDTVVRPILEETSGRRANEGFFLGACPERVMPGRLLANLRSMSRVCGGSTPETARVMAALYRHIVQADLDTTDVVTAELVKTTENAYRDVQIAFANEVALICEVCGADIWRVRELVNKSPQRQMHLPGAGVGGHCIPKDPWLLAHTAGDAVQLRIIPAARAVNDRMPSHMAEMTIEALRAAGRPILRARVAVLGYAYLDDSDDTRNSPSAALVACLEEAGVDVVIHDPWVLSYQGNLLDRVAGADAVILMVGHQEYRTLQLDRLRRVLRTPVLVDGRGLVPAAIAQAAGFVYRGIGQGVSTV